MLNNYDIRMRLAESHVQDLYDEAERARLVRLARRPRTLLRVRVLRLAARGLRVERELDYSSARVPSR